MNKRQFMITVVAFGFFAPKILGGGWDLIMLLCHSMNAGSVVGRHTGDGNTQTEIEFV